MSTTTLAVVAVVVAFTGLAPTSHASEGIAEGWIQQQCAAQYPAGGGYLAGSAYLASPGDAYSWRCRQQRESSNSGVFTDLAVDFGAICDAHGGGRPQPGTGPYDWTCS